MVGDNKDLPSIETESFNQCQKRCDPVPDCVKWTFYGGICYLKGNNTVAYPQVNRISGAKGCNSPSKSGV